MDQERYEEWASMVKGIAKKAAPSLFSRSQEDIEQDLWVKILETEARKGHPIDKALAARVCWDYINDMKDYDQRRNHFSMDLSGSDESGEFDDTQFIHAKSDKGDYDQSIDLKNLYSQFPEGSKERIYLDFYGNISGAMPNSHVDTEDTDLDTLARMLGYASHASGGFRKFRSRMNDLIKSYLQ